jgi:hypothetical protein
MRGDRQERYVENELEFRRSLAATSARCQHLKCSNIVSSFRLTVGGYAAQASGLAKRCLWGRGRQSDARARHHGDSQAGSMISHRDGFRLFTGITIFRWNHVVVFGDWGRGALQLISELKQPLSSVSRECPCTVRRWERVRLPSEYSPKLADTCLDWRKTTPSRRRLARRWDQLSQTG